MNAHIDTAHLVAWIKECSRLIDVHTDALNDLDSTGGDADHGSNLERGFAAVIAGGLIEKTESPRELLKQVGSTIVDVVGGSSGALYGTFFLRMALASGQSEALDGAGFAEMLRAGGQGIVDRGAAQVGDKTLYDSLAPAIAALDSALAAGETWTQALAMTAEAAEAGRDSTVALAARKGRASYLGDRTIGYADAGATSMALILRAATTTLT
jgi:dihydroxyacetone kinase-like protein